MKFRLVNAAALAMIIGAALLHGRWTQRWRPLDRQAVAAALDGVPMRLGTWEGRDAAEEDISVYRDEMDLGLIRRYIDKATGEEVLLMLRGGPPGPIGRHHTPASCYYAAGFGDCRPVATYSFEVADARRNTFWVSSFQKTGAATQRVRVFWGYSGGEGWVAPANPRIDLTGFDVCYKIYVVRALADPDEAVEGDRCERFLRDALPILNRVLFSPAGVVSPPATESNP